jgi:hypothetical protein
MPVLRQAQSSAHFKETIMLARHALGRPHVYYSFSSDGLIISWNPDVMKRAIDRLIERRRQKQNGRPFAAVGRPWLGTSVGFQFGTQFVDMISVFVGDEAREALQALSWAICRFSTNGAAAGPIATR